jgi:hypothetical protein
LTWDGNDLPASQVVPVDTGQIDGYTAAGVGDFTFRFVGLQAAYSRAETIRRNFHYITNTQRAIDKGTGDNRSESGQCEDAIHRQARMTAVEACLGLTQLPDEVLFEFR